MKELSLEERLAGVKAHLDGFDDTLYKIVEHAGDRLKVFSDIQSHQHFLKPVHRGRDEEAFQKLLKVDGISKLLSGFRNKLVALPYHGPGPDYKPLWTPEKVEKLLRDYCEEAGAKPRDLIFALRVATTGKTVGFGLYEGIVLLGPNEAGNRIGWLTIEIDSIKKADS